ncbi:MAG: tRNA pseudouridine(55) synthase TruB [Candidatus Aceula meridiana]|nr:tRNA pseudouridine(55) synthase TruB [Candidatus Aceula meridiana]
MQAKIELKGILIVNKPSGMTSHDVVDAVRKKFRMKRVGHAGTLDPLATGVLVVLIGKATKLFDQFSSFDKAYEATMTLGLVTSTADIKGKTIYERPCEDIAQTQVEEVMKKFVGEIEQIPPMVSAVRYKGKRLYQLARKGIEVKREPRKINIFHLNLLDFKRPNVKFYLECSKGTYVRKIAEDIGDVLGCGACISQIHRTKVGPFCIEKAISLDEVNETHLMRPDEYRNML